MTDFKRIDSTAYDDDQPLDSFLMNRTAQNLRAVREERGRGVTWSPSTLSTLSAGLGDPIGPEISSWRGAEYVLYFYHLAERTTEITVTIRGYATGNVSSGGTDVTLFAGAQATEDFKRGWSLVGAGSSNVTGGTTTPANHAITVDVSGIRPGWIVVWVGVFSAEGTAVEITNTSGTHGDSMFYGALSPCYVLEGNTNLTTADAINHWGVYVGQTGTTKKSDRFPNRKLLFVDYDVGRGNAYRFLLFVTPALPGLSFAGAIEGGSATLPLVESTDALFYIPLGVFRVDSVNIQDSAVSHPDRSARLDAGNIVTTRRILPETAAANSVWTQLTRIHHIGPSNNTADQDFTGTEPLNKISSSVVLENSTDYATLGGCLVGAGDPYEYNGTAYNRTRYALRMFVVLTVPANPGARGLDLFAGADFEIAVDFRVELETQNPSSPLTLNRDFDGYPLTALAGPAYTVLVDGTHQPTSISNMDRYIPLAYRLDFKPAMEFGNTIGAHSSRGTILQGEQQLLTEIGIEFSDDLNLDARALNLKVKLNATSYDALNQQAQSVTGQRLQYKPRLHLLTWTVATAPYFGEVNPADLGV